MTWWQDPRSRLVALYTALVVVFSIAPALPGHVDYTDGGAYGLWIALELILVFFIARGSRVAVAIALVIVAAVLVAVLLTASNSDFGAVDFVVLVVVLVAQSAVLLRLLLLRQPELRASGA